MTLKEELEKEEADRLQWDLGDYDNPDNGCPNCGRHRVCKTPNGKHRCEKCNWIIEDNKYCEYES